MRARAASYVHDMREARLNDVKIKITSYKAVVGKIDATYATAFYLSDQVTELKVGHARKVRSARSARVRSPLCSCKSNLRHAAPD